jgi:hypothetical protein
VVRCDGDSALGRRGFDTPAWMLDRAVCSTMKLSPTPFVDTEALAELRSLLDWALGKEEPGVVEGGYRLDVGQGGTYAEITTPTRATGVVSGVVAARQVSRFARISKDWQHLIEVCRMMDTLLLDQEVVYDSRNSNDRLLLGLKGSLNEYELDLLRLRSQEARRQEAARGELIVAAPVGYIKTADQRLEKDPDLRVQEAIRLTYRKFFELGPVRQTMLGLVGQGLDLPVARHTASGREIAWKRPGYSTVLNILRDPIYAGPIGTGNPLSGR